MNPMLVLVLSHINNLYDIPKIPKCQIPSCNRKCKKINNVYEIGCCVVHTTILYNETCLLAGCNNKRKYKNGKLELGCCQLHSSILNKNNKIK